MVGPWLDPAQIGQADPDGCCPGQEHCAGNPKPGAGVGQRGQNTSADQAAGFELQAILAKRVLVGWSKHLGVAAGKRTKGQLDADIKKMGAPVVADANAALNGDKAAAKRGADRGKACSSLEVVEAARTSNG